MQFYTIITCTMIWILGVLASKFILLIKSIRMKRQHRLKALYMHRLISYTDKGYSAKRLMKELYFSFSKVNDIKYIIFKAMKMELQTGFNYINSKIGCPPMRIIHEYIVKRQSYIADKESSRIPEDVKNRVMEEISEWEQQFKEELKAQRIIRIKLFVNELIVFAVNLYLYLSLQTKISMVIFVVVNTLAVLLSIMVDYEGSLIDGFKRVKRKSQKPANGLRTTYQLMAGLGLIINISTVAAWWLGPIA